MNRTENPCVPGSIPGDTTLKIRELQKCDSLFLCCFVPCFKAGQAMGGNVGLVYGSKLNREFPLWHPIAKYEHGISIL